MKRFLLYLLAGFLGTLCALFFFVFFWTALVLGGSTEPPVDAASVLTVDLEGPLPEQAPFDVVGSLLGERILTLRDVTEALEKAAVDDRITAVWLRPEGVDASWATLAAVRDALDAYRASGKPLIASSGADGFGEAGYYLASVADSIFTPPEASFELNGFQISAPFFAGTLDKLGIRPQVIRAGDYKSAAEMLTNREFSPENRQQYRELLDHTSATFLTTVAEARGLSVDALDAVIAQGGMYDARAAAEIGLIDDLRYESGVADVFRLLTEQDADDELRTVELDRYVGVSPTVAGVEAGDAANQIAVVYAVGQIVPGESIADNGGGAFLGSDTFAETMREATRDDRVRAIVVRVDSPGGSATASDVMWHAVAEAAERVPVVVSMGAVAASGGYYLAAPADAIVAEPSTITGSIGVISVLFDATEFFNDKLGVTFDTLQTGPAAGLYALGDPLDATERAILERSTERIYDTFVRRVADGRNLSPDSVRALGGGRVYTGDRAEEIGLIDALGTLDDAVALAADMAELEEGAYRTYVLPEEKSFLEQLEEGFGAQTAAQAIAQRLGLGRATPEEAFLHRRAALLREAARLHATPQARLFEEVRVR
jgi:protease-4